MFNWAPLENEEAFDVALHIGTLAAVVVYFFFEWLLIFGSYIGDVRQGRWLGTTRGSLLPKIIVASVPGAIIGKLFDKRIEDFFWNDNSHIWMIAVSLAVFGLLLLISEIKGSQRRDMTDISYRDALIIGAAQALALVPGVSRSGVTIFAALFLGLTRPAAARFSFLMATPIIAGAALLKVRQLHHLDASLFIGIAVSGVVGILTIGFLLKYVQTRRYAVFAYYRWILAAVVLTLFFTRHQASGPSPAALSAVRQAQAALKE